MKTIFTPPPFIEVTPVLAGNDHPMGLGYTQPDASGRPQIVNQPPIKLRYTNTNSPLSVPEYDFTGQVLGDSMSEFGLKNGDIVLCQRFTNEQHLKIGDKVVRNFVSEGVNADWKCLQQVHSAEDDGKMVLKSMNDGAVKFDSNCVINDIIYKAVYKLVKPSHTPLVVGQVSPSDSNTKDSNQPYQVIKKILNWLKFPDTEDC